MAITVRFFASLADAVGCREKTIAGDQAGTAQEAWDACVEGSDVPGSVLVAVNQQYASMDSVIADGDEIAFFPPVTGG